MSYLQSLEVDWVNWKELQSDTSAHVYYLQTDLQYVPFYIAPNSNTFPDAEAVYFININRDPSSVSGPYAYLSSGVQAYAHIQSITYTAVNYGTAGNSITITYANDAIAVGQEYVTISGTAITVHIVSGVSTAQQVQAAVNGWNAYTGLANYHSAASSYLVNAVIDAGQEGIPQTTQGPTSLANGTNAVTVLSDWTTNYLGSATLTTSFANGIADSLS